MLKRGGADEEVKIAHGLACGTKATALTSKHLAGLLIKADHIIPLQKILESAFVSLGVRGGVDPLVEFGQRDHRQAEALFFEFIQTLHQEVEPVAVWIDHPPQRVRFAGEAEKDFIEVRLITRSGAAMPSLVRGRWPELPAPAAHGFMREDDAAGGHQLFAISVAQAETEVEPDTVADDLGRKPMALIEVGWW
jgi:hypothetical protein